MFATLWRASAPMSAGFLPGRGPDFWTVGLVMLGNGVNLLFLISGGTAGRAPIVRHGCEQGGQLACEPSRRRCRLTGRRHREATSHPGAGGCKRRLRGR